MLGHIGKQVQQRSSHLKERSVKHLRIVDTKTLYDVYEFKEEIGHGAYGTVISAVEKQTAKKYAIKIVNKFTTGANQLQEVYSEIKILKSVDHPNIVYLERVYESPRKIYMVLERCTNNLNSVFKEEKLFTEKVTKKITKQLVSAVYYLHKHDIVHRDIKLENILLTNNPADASDKHYIKLSDFGLSIIKTGAGVQSMLKEYCGTIIYMEPAIFYLASSATNTNLALVIFAFLGYFLSKNCIPAGCKAVITQRFYNSVVVAPEILLQHSYSELCDVWAIGIILYLLLFGDFPFFSNNEEELLQKICNSTPIYQNSDTTVSYEAIDLIKCLLEKDPANRITALEILQHPWMVENKVKQKKDENVLEYMKKWKSEMKIPNADEEDADWMTTVTDFGQDGTISLMDLKLEETPISVCKAASKSRLVDDKKRYNNPSSTM